MKAGYDVHMNNDKAFKHCIDYNLLKFFIDIGTDIKSSGEAWVGNFLNSYYRDKAGVLKLMFGNGLDPETNGGIIIQYACTSMYLELFQLLDDLGIDLKRYEKTMVPLIGIHGLCYMTEEDSERKIPNSLKILQILSKLGFNFKSLSNHFIRCTIRNHDARTLVFMFENGVDVNSVVNSLIDYDISSSNKIQTFNTLISNGIDINKAIALI